MLDDKTLRVLEYDKNFACVAGLMISRPWLILPSPSGPQETWDNLSIGKLEVSHEHPWN